MSSTKFPMQTSEDKEAKNKLLDAYTEAPWDIIETYFKNCHLTQLVRHQLESYNDFVTHQIQKTIDMFNPVVIKSENDKDPATGKYSLEINITYKKFLFI